MFFIPYKLHIFFRRVSFCLADVFRRITKKEPVDQHRAECDVDMLIQCASTLGEEFVGWANKNSKKFLEIPALQATNVEVKT